jgi:hypothetical protein
LPLKNSFLSSSITALRHSTLPRRRAVSQKSLIDFSLSSCTCLSLCTTICDTISLEEEESVQQTYAAIMQRSGKIDSHTFFTLPILSPGRGFHWQVTTLAGLCLGTRSTALSVRKGLRRYGSENQLLILKGVLLVRCIQASTAIPLSRVACLACSAATNRVRPRFPLSRLFMLGGLYLTEDEWPYNVS